MDQHRHYVAGGLGHSGGTAPYQHIPLKSGQLGLVDHFDHVA